MDLKKRYFTRVWSTPYGVADLDGAGLMKSWAIFCKVIDNYGDIGVSWRLARQLACEYSCEVHLWVDELEALTQIWPDVDSTLAQQVVAGVKVMSWHDEIDFSKVFIADVLVEAFACDAPAQYIESLAQRAMKTGVTPKWVNLEYLSAEQWVDGHHLLNSPQRNGLNKVFFFPGFSDKTGGLLREAVIRNDVGDFYGHVPESLKISLFGYDSMPLHSWLPCLMKSNRPIQLAVTSGKATKAMQTACSDLGIHHAGLGALTIKYLPMLTQIEFDGLLQKSDLNFVRGEDSLVRAIWSEKPFTWHIYPQDDGAHWAKLDAFTARYGTTMTSSLFSVFNDWQKVWNGEATICFEASWLRLVAHLPSLSHIAVERAQYWQEQDDLTAQLWAWSQ